MRFVHLFLIGYGFLVVGGFLALWKAGVLASVAPVWIAIGVIIAIGVGVMLSVSSGKPAIAEEVQKK